MNKFMTIWRREMYACFLSPVAYVTMVAFLAVTGFTFWFGAMKSAGEPQPVTLLLFGGIIFWLPILITVVSMRLFVEEKRSGTIENLMTAPVREVEIILGKYFGALTFLLIVLAPAVADLFILERLSPGLTMQNIDQGAVIGGCFVLLLVTGMFLSVALVVSLLTRTQIVSAICTFVAIWLFLLCGWLIGMAPGTSQAAADAISVILHVENFARGTIELRSIVLYLTVSSFMLFAAVRVLESRRWH